MLAPPFLKSVVVVGSGLAGLSAAIEAYRCGAHVTILEKEPRVGGNSAKATSGMNAVPTMHQAEHGIKDSIHLFEQDTVRSGPEESRPRTHREKPRADGKPAPVGWDIIRTLQGFVEKSGIEVVKGAKVEEVLEDREGVKGVRFVVGEDLLSISIKCKELEASAVVLATGGFSNDHTETSLLRQYAPHLTDRPTTNGAWATGDGVKIGLKLGAETVDMDKVCSLSTRLAIYTRKKVQLHPTGFVDPKDPTALVKFLAPESLRAYGGILLDPITSRRFVNELGTRDAVSAAMETLGRASYILLINKNVVEGFDGAAVNFYMFKGLIGKLEGLEKVCEEFGLDLDIVREQLEAYNVSEAAKTDSFGKTLFPCTFDEKDAFYVARVAPVIHYTMGGLKINSKTEVQRGDGSVIKGLYAAGEVTGGVHGFNRLAGNSLLECVVFGRVAGQQAASSL
ncbi:cleavage and polyadenylation specificity factor subunit 2 [Phlyctochytrium planicorne]|nr:cleavage and polyadenylation specificity factor subunit 2 [Phlyctochytrium planicorne]